MKWTAAICFLLLACAAQAQTPSARNAAYLEIGGNAIVPSINYERRLSPRWLGRVGLSYVVGESENDTDTTFVIPLTLSTLVASRGNHHFELGGGVTIATGDRQELFQDTGFEEKFTQLFVTGIAGYRYQKPGRGFQFRATATPLLAGSELAPWFGVSFGYAW